MSDTPNAPSPSDAPPPQDKKRNPVERVIVWGLIAAMAVVVTLEGTARFGYTSTLNKLQDALARDEGPDAIALHLNDVSAHVSGFPTRQVSEGKLFSVVEYRWKGLLKDYGGIRLSYSNDDQIVMGLETDLPPEEPELPLAVAPAAEESSPMDMMQANSEGGSGGGPGGPGGPGGRGPSFEEMDADGDGKLSRDETPERLADSFDEIDANADGFIDEEELTAYRAARRAARDREPRPESERPERPEAAPEN